MCIFRRPTNNTHICDENRSHGGRPGQLRKTSWPAEKTHVASEYVILVEKNRVIGDASVEAPVYASRGVRINGVENCFARQSARPLLRMLGRLAAADLPGLRPFRRGSWK